MSYRFEVIESDMLWECMSLTVCVYITGGKSRRLKEKLFLFKKKYLREIYIHFKLIFYLHNSYLNRQVEMTEYNLSLTTEFTLTGFTDHPELKTLLFLVFLTIYLITIVGNLGLVALIITEHRLQTPMYIFLGNLALMDSCCSSTITPKMLQNLFSKDRMISLYECMAQFYFLCLAETTDSFLLAAMAYDRYVAICKPLKYHTMMSKKLCIQMTTGAYIVGNLHPMIHVGFLFRLTFCRSHQINHFFCDVLPLYRLSCRDPDINELMLFIVAGSLSIFTIIIVIISYLFILFMVLKMKSKEGKGKALSTCASHFLSVSIFYGSLLFTYVRPNSVNDEDKDIPLAIFYTLVIPLLNPFIYSLRNRDVINAMKKSIKMLSVQFSHSLVSNSLQPHGLQHIRPPYPSPTPGIYSCPLSQ